LNYHALDTALCDLAKSKKQDKRVLQLQSCAQAYRKDDGIVLKLYRTEIITFYPDHTIIDCHGWVDRVTTRNWLRCAGHYVYAQKLNQWDSSVYLYHQRWGGDVLYYDGIVIGKDGQVTSERKPIVKRVPNAEAKALRRRMTALQKEYYMPDLRFMDLSPNWGEHVRQAWDRDHVPDFTEPPADAYANIASALAYKSNSNAAPSKLFVSALSNEWARLVEARKLFDEVPYQLKEK
jgi:hypothetical protein